MALFYKHNEDDDENNPNNDSYHQLITFRLFFRQGATRSGIFATRSRHQSIRTANDTTAKITRSKRRYYFIVDNPAGQNVGHRTFQTVADLDAQFTRLGKNKKHHAVVVRFLTRAP